MNCIHLRFRMRRRQLQQPRKSNEGKKVLRKGQRGRMVNRRRSTRHPKVRDCGELGIHAGLNDIHVGDLIRRPRKAVTNSERGTEGDNSSEESGQPEYGSESYVSEADEETGDLEEEDAMSEPREEDAMEIDQEEGPTTL